MLFLLSRAVALVFVFSLIHPQQPSLTAQPPGASRAPSLATLLEHRLYFRHYFVFTNSITSVVTVPPLGCPPREGRDPGGLVHCRVAIARDGPCHPSGHNTQLLIQEHTRARGSVTRTEPFPEAAIPIFTMRGCSDLLFPECFPLRCFTVFTSASSKGNSSIPTSVCHE